MAKIILILLMILLSVTSNQSQPPAPSHTMVIASFNKMLFIEISRRPDRFYNKQLLT